MGFRPDFAAGPALYADGVVQSGQQFRAQRDGSLIVAESHGKWYEAASRGTIYHATTLTAGIALIVSATTGNHPTLWNPNSAGTYNAEFVKLVAARVSGTDAPGAWYWCSTNPAGAAIATGGPIATWTNVAPLSGLLGPGAADSIMKWAPAINTYTAAPVFYAPVGVTMYTGTVAAVIAELQLVIEYDGDLIVGPNSALSLTTQVATSTALYALDLAYNVSRA
jgi:hypothetical protein